MNITEPGSLARTRCAWARTELAIAYHDREWGVPQHDDQTLFEFLILEGAQAGLSWETILKKRPAYRRAFDDFDPALVANYDASKIRSLMQDIGIVRNRLKIAAAVGNAQAFLRVQTEFVSFDRFLRRFVGGRPAQGPAYPDRVTRSAESDALSKDFLKRGFKFVGTTICYALMQAVGLVNDHAEDCFRRREVARLV